jgi:cytochrome c5
VRRDWLCFVLLALSLACAGMAAGQPAGDGDAAEQNQASASQASRAQTPQTNKPPVNRGALVFEANCARCHNPPEALRPSEVRAVVRQMRVRANLSADDEQALVKFLAP